MLITPDICQGEFENKNLALTPIITQSEEDQKMKKTCLFIAAVLLSAGSAGVIAGDAAAGKSKSATCAACHGANGISPNDIWPNLAGQKEGYLVAQMKAFRDGQRANPMMAPMAAPLSDADIADLAAYYAGLGQ
jgi:cytochrome c553